MGILIMELLLSFFLLLNLSYATGPDDKDIQNIRKLESLFDLPENSVQSNEYSTRLVNSLKSMTEKGHGHYIAKNILSKPQYAKLPGVSELLKMIVRKGYGYEVIKYVVPARPYHQNKRNLFKR